MLQSDVRIIFGLRSRGPLHSALDPPLFQLWPTILLLFVVWDTDNKSVIQLTKDAEIPVLAGLVKMYFRELPESIVTDALYKELSKAMGEQLRFKISMKFKACMLAFDWLACLNILAYSSRPTDDYWTSRAEWTEFVCDAVEY